MAFEDLDTLGKVVAKANLLAERYEILAKSRDEAQARVAELEGRLLVAERELESLRAEAEYLRMAAVISPDRDQIEQTRAIVSGLVREIDRCITDLSD